MTMPSGSLTVSIVAVEATAAGGEVVYVATLRVSWALELAAIATVANAAVRTR